MQLRTSIGALAALMLAAGTAGAQCVNNANGKRCFGTDVNGNASTRATNVNSLAAQTAFLAGLVNPGVENFESFAVNAGPDLNVNFAGAGITATLDGNTGDGVRSVVGGGTDGNGRYSISPTKFYETSAGAGAPETNFRLNFNAPTAAFGFYGVDVGDFSAQFSLRVTLVGGATEDWVLPYTASQGQNSARDGSILFAGFVDTRQFTAIEFRANNPGVNDDVFAFDNFTVASLRQVQIVPEPSTYALMATGLIGLVGIARRRRA
ncbi:MAG: PEP-CTERM sorting domain-containing protein [Gemmatimonadaceae bacterium]|jgi:hypothetical protein|nr:PEP-CTERM sorting domain-containing protein [Gemmatimonadaceae bacterium]